MGQARIVKTTLFIFSQENNMMFLFDGTDMNRSNPKSLAVFLQIIMYPIPTQPNYVPSTSLPSINLIHLQFPPLDSIN